MTNFGEQQTYDYQLKPPCRSQIIPCHIKTYLFIIYILPVYSSKETMTHDFFCIIWASTKSKESGEKNHIKQALLLKGD